MICSYCKSQSFTLPLHPERNLMKQTLSIFILSLFALHLRAQQMISVIDIDTRQPVAQAFFIQEGDTIAYTSPQGMALVPKRPGIVTISARDYKPLILNADSLPAVIRIKCEVERLEEVYVIGDKNKIISKKSQLEKGSKAISPAQGGGVAVGIDAIFRALGYRPASEKRRERVKKNLDAYDKKESSK